MKTTDYPVYYFPFLQDDNPGAYTYYVRATGNGPSVLPASIRREISRISPVIAVYQLRWMDSQIDLILSVERAISTMSVFFGALAAIGLYGVMSYTVTRRTKEIGIRIALGAERGYVLWLVLKEVAAMAVIGLCAGVPAALFFSRYVEAQVYGMTAADPLTMLIAVVAMLTIAILAGLLPAHRAAALDPIRALRYE
jgi:ABC-type antimicrobial peptide transport system permease subunit